MIDFEKIFENNVQSEEKLFKDTENIVFGNIDDFTSDKTNILLITGLSGSGKTSIVNNYKDSKTKVIHLDDIEHYISNCTDDELKKIFGKSVHEFFTKTEIGKVHRKDKNLEAIALFTCIAYILLHEKSKVILEGVQLLYFCYTYDKAKKKLFVNEKNVKVLTKFPFIIMGKSFVNSTKDALKRNFNNFKQEVGRNQTFSEKVKETLRVISLNLEMEKTKNKIIKYA